MKLIVINAISALRGGGQTYLINFLEHLPEGNFKVFLLVNSKNKAVFDKYSSERITVYEAVFASKNIMFRSLWERFSLPRLLTKQQANVYYAPGGVMTTKMPPGVVSATALRNMLPFDERERKRFPLISYIRFKLWLLRFVFLKSYKMADKVVFISEHSKSVVKKYIPNIDKKSEVIPHGLNTDFLDAEGMYDLPKQLKKNQFYLYVSILDVYKAQKEVVKAWATLFRAGFDFPLVLVGPKYNEYGDEVLQLIEELGLQEKVIYLGKVDYEKLPLLYQSARALIFASSCECCPNILLEKLAAGKPVLCSNIEPMPEFAESAAVYFNPYEPEILVQKVKTLEGNQEEMELLAQKAKQQALKFNWDETVKSTVDFLLDNNSQQ